MRREPIILLILITLALAARADSQVFAGYVYSGNSLTVDKQVIFIHLSENGIIADYGKGSLEITNNSCESTDYFRVCLDNIDFDYTAKKKRISIRAISTIPSITITRSVSKSELVVGEEATFTVTLTNTGGVARNASFQDSFSDSFEVYDVDGAYASNHMVSWSGIIGRSGTKEIEYKIKAKKQAKQVTKATLSYFDGYVTRNAYSSEQTINAAHFLLIESGVGKTSTYVGQPNNFTINITNKGNNSINATVEIEFSPDITVYPPLQFTKTGKGMFKWSGEIRKRNLSNNRFFSKPFTFDISSGSIGASQIIIRASYADLTTQENLEMQETKKEVKVSDAGVAIRTNINDAVIESNQLFKAKIWVQNLNPYAPIKDVLVSAYTGVGYLPDVYFSEIGKGVQVLAIEKEIYAPNTSSTTGFPIDINMTYNINGGKFAKSLKSTISVTNIRDLTINHIPSKTSVESGETFTFTVTMNNPRLTGINNVNVFDTIPPEFDRYGQTSSSSISIPKKDTLTVYTYEVTAPKVNQEKTFQIRTNAEYSDSGNEFLFSEIRHYNISKETKITVLPAKFPLSVTSTFPDTEFYTGHESEINYVIRNPSDTRTAKGVVLHFPLQPEFDTIGITSMEIPDIDPGESVYLTSKHKIRPKLNDTRVLLKPYLTYTDGQGSNYTYNHTTTSLKVKTTPIYGPALILTKNSSEKANNTDKFNVTLNVRNIGSEAANAEIINGNEKFSLQVQPNSEYSRNDTMSIPEPGPFEIPPATATYTYQNLRLYTASNSKTIEVISKPLLKLEKTAPEKANNLDPIEIAIRVINLQEAPLDVKITDGESQWVIAGLTGERTLKSNISLSKTGSTLLEKPTASYVYGNHNYTVSAETSPMVEVSEKSFASLEKSSSKQDAKAGDEITITLTLRSTHESALEAELKDSGRAWNISLAPGKEEKVSYKIKANEMELPEATATFSYLNKKHTVKSNNVMINITEEHARPEKKEMGAEENLFKKIINGIIRILTIKRSDI